jgi:hypothetical protein
VCRRYNLVHYLAIHPNVQGEIFNEANKISPADLEVNHEIRSHASICQDVPSTHFSRCTLPRSIGLGLKGLNGDDTLWHGPKEFNTNRFNVDREDSPKLVSHSDKFVHFGVGRRPCPGDRIRAI